ncbi:MAG: hypothetical protein ACFFHV_14455 [Promethearchaeota archaeon]
MDISSNYALYFPLVGLVFILFFFMLSIFGYFILFLIKKLSQNKENMPFKSILEELFLSFGIGISLYISLSYFLDLFALFNFYTAYLPLIIFDLLFIIYYYIKNKEVFKKKWNKDFFSDFLKAYVSKKDNIFLLGVIILTILIISIIQWFIIIESTSLIYTDPYKWYADTFYLLDNGHINYNQLDYNYPSGFTYFNAGVLLIYPDYLFGYYYFKFIPLYFISFYVIIAFSIIRKLFNEKYLILLSGLLILTSRYFLSRTLLYLSSALASGLLIISLIIIINKYPDYIMGFFIAGMYFIHNLTTFYYLFVLLCFYLYRVILNLKNHEILMKQIRFILISIVIILILLIPYIVGIYVIYQNTIFDLISHFFFRFEEADYAYISYRSYNLYPDSIKLIYPLDFFTPFIEIRLLELFDELFERSIYLFFILPLIGLIINIKTARKNKEQQENLVFFKLFIVVTIIFFFLPYFFLSLNLFIKFRKRILQSFSLPIIIMTLYSIEWIVKLAMKLTNFLTLKFSFYRKIANAKKFYGKYFKIESIIISILMVSISSSFVMHRYPDYYYYYDDDLVEVVLYLRTHAESGSTILREDFDSAVIFRVLYDMKIKTYEVNESSSYQDLILEIKERKIDYLIFSKGYFNNNTVEESLCDNNNLKNVLENDDYILFRIK